jgi:hypothetical protein
MVVSARCGTIYKTNSLFSRTLVPNAGQIDLAFRATSELRRLFTRLTEEFGMTLTNGRRAHQVVVGRAMR